MLLRVRRRKLVFYKEWKILCGPEKKGGKDGGGGGGFTIYVSLQAQRAWE